MCGIIGFTGGREAQSILLDGLSSLEYRGYDSAGISYFGADGKIHIRKTIGKVKDLRAICDDENSATCGIGHTRWATHGGVCDKNAHPHRSGKVTLVHNGIIENYADLRDEYELEDKLVTETDTEVVAALIDKLYDGDPKKTIKRVIKKIKGTFAFVIMFADKPDTIYAVRNVSPIVATTTENATVLSSDPAALFKYSKEYFVLDERIILTDCLWKNPVCFF